MCQQIAAPLTTGVRVPAPNLFCGIVDQCVHDIEVETKHNDFGVFEVLE
jgi:hypothetical protein